MATYTTAKNMNGLDRSTTIIVEEIINTIVPDFLEKSLGDNKQVLENLCSRLQDCEETKNAMIKIIRENFPNPEIVVVKEKKTKVPKDKDAPKRNKSAYLFYTMKNRELLKKKFPDDSAQEIVSKLGAAWTEAKENKKIKKYEKMAEKDKERYQDEKSAYIPSDEYKEILADYEENPEKYKKKTRGKKKIVDPNKPKRPTGAFFSFCGDNRDTVKKDNPDLKATEVSKLLGDMWKTELDSKTKEKYKTTFALQMIEYKKKMSDRGKNQQNG